MQKINVTKTFLPPLEDYEKYLRKIWSNAYLTNQGPLLEEFEKKTKKYLGVDNFHFVSNGTIALQIALHSLGITEGEIITTPFTYVATTSAILWERCDPVFVDIEPETFCIDPSKIEAAITPRTRAIIAVHVFGQPCDVDAINEIAQKHNLKVIYDAAHAFGVRYKNKSLLDYGDVSTCSFHATKVFHTIEGGCVIAHGLKEHNTLELVKRFGHEGDTHKQLGINAKSSEFQAAMGLCNLRYVDENIRKRQSAYELYNKLIDSENIKTPSVSKDVQYNYSYYPVLFKTEKLLLQTLKKMNDKNIYPRRYFYPSLNDLPYIRSSQSCPVSEDIARRILCLPLFVDMQDKIIHKIVKVMQS